MKMYSFHLERFSEFSRSIFKRRRFMHFETLRLLLYVKESTDRPHYEDLSTLLNAGFLAIKGKEADIPRFFSSEGLAKLSQRTTNFGLTSRF